MNADQVNLYNFSLKISIDEFLNGFTVTAIFRLLRVKCARGTSFLDLNIADLFMEFVTTIGLLEIKERLHYTVIWIWPRFKSAIKAKRSVSTTVEFEARLGGSLDHWPPLVDVIYRFGSSAHNTLKKDSTDPMRLFLASLRLWAVRMNYFYVFRFQSIQNMLIFYNTIKISAFKVENAIKHLAWRPHETNRNNRLCYSKTSISFSQKNKLHYSEWQ